MLNIGVAVIVTVTVACGRQCLLRHGHGFAAALVTVNNTHIETVKNKTIIFFIVCLS